MYELKIDRIIKCTELVIQISVSPFNNLVGVQVVDQYFWWARFFGVLK
jgi:hypothetical protein